MQLNMFLPGKIPFPSEPDTKLVYPKNAYKCNDEHAGQCPQGLM